MGRDQWAACEWEADWMVRCVDSNTAADQPMGALLLSFGYVQCKLKVYKKGIFYNKEIPFAYTRGSVHAFVPHCYKFLSQLQNIVF